MFENVDAIFVAAAGERAAAARRADREGPLVASLPHSVQPSETNRWDLASAARRFVRTVRLLTAGSPGRAPRLRPASGR